MTVYEHLNFEKYSATVARVRTEIQRKSVAGPGIFITEGRGSGQVGWCAAWKPPVGPELMVGVLGAKPLEADKFLQVKDFFL
jgi:hypothetical protein